MNVFFIAFCVFVGGIVGIFVGYHLGRETERELCDAEFSFRCRACRREQMKGGIR